MHNNQQDPDALILDIMSKKLSHKEKYGKMNSRGSRNNFDPIKNGFYHQIPSKIPEGYNACLGYCTETVTAAQRKQERKYL